MRKVSYLAVFLVTSVTTSLVLAYTKQQADQGQKVYGENCAVCHGAKGEGGRVPRVYGPFAGMKAPPVAGAGALPNMDTAENVYYFLKLHMPLQKPGSLSDTEYLDIVAFDLMANDVAKPSAKALTVKELAGMKLHAAPKK